MSLTMEEMKPMTSDRAFLKSDRWEEWRYTFLSPKIIALDAGHLCQNLYLASESIGVGTCALGAYDQLKMDALLGVDGEDEFAIYVAPVGKIA